MELKSVMVSCLNHGFILIVRETRTSTSQTIIESRFRVGRRRRKLDTVSQP
ncbi:hypothetical protein N665_0902s0005 [Sinapis alba]|nr:hypothetical protein N665_0902s0005 [Sinapis alba]